jgi:hypothetical protein
MTWNSTGEMGRLVLLAGHRPVFPQGYAFPLNGAGCLTVVSGKED